MSEYEQYQQEKSTKAKKSASKSREINHTGIPTQLKKKFETVSGFSFDDVRVHHNSEKPAQLRALAYTQGSNVYIGPGQEQHLKHELGHVIQQKQGIVTPTGEINGKKLNDNSALERAADKWKGI